MDYLYNSDIDFVILWVDGNDRKWLQKKAQYVPNLTADVSKERYRDWDNLKYWFRGVAKYAPWVRKIHFVTDEQVPEWLNTENPHLHCVNHSDYISEDVLPLFNSNAIEIGIHKIPDLADKFVLFNDDVFLTQPITPEYYFTNGLPNDMAGLTRKCIVTEENTFANILSNDYALLNAHFRKKQVIKSMPEKWLKLSYGKTFLRTLLNLGRNNFDGMVIPHLSVPYLKTDFEKVWNAEGNLLSQTQAHRFRENGDLNHFIFRYWRMCEGAFHPVCSKGKYISLRSVRDIDQAVTCIRRHSHPELCLNDTWQDIDFENAKAKLNAAFEETLREKCEYEI